MAVTPQLQQRIPFVDGERRLTNEALRSLNDAFKTVVDALNAAIAAQDEAIAAALEATAAATAANAAQTTADSASTDAGAAQSTADDALALAGTAVQQDVGPAWSPASGTGSRLTYTSYAGQTVSNPPTQAEVQQIDDHLVMISQRMKALVDDLTGNGSLTL